MTVSRWLQAIAPFAGSEQALSEAKGLFDREKDPLLRSELALTCEWNDGLKPSVDGFSRRPELALSLRMG